MCMYMCVCMYVYMCIYAYNNIYVLCKLLYLIYMYVYVYVYFIYIYIHYPRWLCLMYITLMHPNITLHFMLMYLYIILYIIFVQTYCIYTCNTTLHLNHTFSQLPFPLPPLSLNKCVNCARGARSGFSDLLTEIS